MAVASLGELFGALGAGNFELLIDTPEGADIDFKRDPYQLDTERGRWELAKDVGSFANLGGGALVIGVSTERHPNALVETAKEIRRVRKDLINADQYKDIVTSRLFPVVAQVRFHWFPPALAENTGIFVIEVPRQNDRDRHFLVRRMLDDGDKPIQAIGVPCRDGANTHWLSPEEVHRNFMVGLKPPPAGAEARPHLVRPDMKRQAKTHVSEVEKLDDWKDIPIFFLQGLPPEGPDTLPTFYERDGIRRALMDPPSIRPTGFGLYTGEDPEVREGALSCMGGSRKALWLEPFGLFTAAAAVTPDFLGWAINDRRGPEAPLRVNSITLVEFTLEFFRFIYNQLSPRAGAGRWTFQVICRGFKARRVVSLSEGKPQRFPEDGPPASSDNWHKEFEGEGHAGKDAYLALTRFYGLFGLPATTIPFIQGEEVSEDAIRAIG